MFVSSPSSLVKFFMRIVDLFIALVDGYKEKDAFFSLSGTIKDVDVFWNSVINENITSIYLLTDPNSGKSIYLPEESSEIKLETANIKRVVSSKGQEASRTKPRVKRYKINGKKVLNMHFFKLLSVFFFDLETNSLYNDTGIMKRTELLRIFMVDKVVPKTNFVCSRSFY